MDRLSFFILFFFPYGGRKRTETACRSVGAAAGALWPPLLWPPPRCGPPPPLRSPRREGVLLVSRRRRPFAIAWRFLSPRKKLKNANLERLPRAEGIFSAVQLYLYPIVGTSMKKHQFPNKTKVCSINSVKEICERFYRPYKRIFLPLDTTNIKGFIHLTDCNQQQTEALH